jgi:hypothetical protein
MDAFASANAKNYIIHDAPLKPLMINRPLIKKLFAKFLSLLMDDLSLMLTMVHHS